ncbi:PQQ-binding-like beta-propeller repeat protein [Agarivorans sp. B2Z047]|uniref:outer membrane protein assembly factor BamB family protein n=1 Tax=Agarivorans sp. B2Z047 TaxID=2652721 RepID=UPI0018831421|nr:PQQ-binding-like beta-propeller repeat protein [Agarivorans sp. B2Z047]UQN41937.1 PQQ-like beta-propeller repeat protein [Agarivorans sp. B2Z047]
MVENVSHVQHYSKKLDMKISVPISATPVCISNIGVIICGSDGFINMYSEDLSDIKWRHRLNSRIYATPTVLFKKKQIIVGDVDGTVVVLDYEGKRISRIANGKCIYNNIVTNEEETIAYFNTFERKLYCVSIDKLDVLWVANLPTPWFKTQESFAANRDPYAAPVITDQGTILSANGNKISAFTKKGIRVWEIELPAMIRATPALCFRSKRGVAPCVNGKVVVFDYDLGKTLMIEDLQGRIVNSPGLSNMSCCVGDLSGNLLCIDLNELSAKWRVNVGAGLDHGSVTSTPAGDFVFITDRGNAICLSYEDGSFIWESMQTIGLPNQSTKLNQSLNITNNGKMYASSYDGYVYSYIFEEEKYEAYPDYK